MFPTHGTPRNLEVRNPSNAALQVKVTVQPSLLPTSWEFWTDILLRSTWGQLPSHPHFACTEPAWPRTFCPPMVPAAWHHPSELTGLSLHIWLNMTEWTGVILHPPAVPVLFCEFHHPPFNRGLHGLTMLDGAYGIGLWYIFVYEGFFNHQQPLKKGLVWIYIYIINDITFIIHIYKPSINDDQKKKKRFKNAFPDTKIHRPWNPYMNFPSSGPVWA